MMHELIRLTASRRGLRHKTNLPEGYRLVKRGEKLALLSPGGKQILAGLDAWNAASKLEEAAWSDVWREIERRVNQEMVELKAGVRQPNDLERLPQYFRLLQAVQATPESHLDARRLRRLPVGAVSSFALFLAGAALILLARKVSAIIRFNQS